MDINELYNQYTSDEQKRDYDLLVQLSDKVNSEIIQDRDEAVDCLLNENLMLSEKESIIKATIQKRIDFVNQEITICGKVYKYGDIISLSEKLSSDRTFIGNDSEYVINGLAFLDNSITFEDCLIAFHLYRLSHEKEAYEWLVYLLCQHIYYSLSMESNCKEFTVDEENSDDKLRKLVRFVDGFWNEYAENIQEKGLFLSDDKKVDFYQKIDVDASFYFEVNDLEEKGEIEESKHIKAEYASNLISRCAKSIYLLFSTITEDKSGNYSSERKMLRRDIIEICDQLYSGESDAFGTLAEDKFLNSDKMSLFEDENEISLLKITLKNALDKLNGLDTTSILENRQESLRMVMLPDSKELVEEFTKEFSNKLMKSIPDNLETYYERVKKEIGDKFYLLPQEALHELGSAEFLFDRFVKNKAPEDFDYSGVAILYFQAFETAYDELVIRPYSEWLIKQNVENLIKAYIDSKKRNGSKMSVSDENKLLTYFSKKFDIKSFYRNNKNEKGLASYLEIGTFKYFIDVRESLGAKEGEQGNQLVYYLEQECFKKPIDKKAISNFVDALSNAYEPRNKAAHGLYKIKEYEVREDKIIVYDETDIKNILDYKNLLYAFLDFFR